MSDSTSTTITMDNLFVADYPNINGSRTVAISQTLLRGAVLGAILAAAGTAVPDVGNTGDGVVSAFALAAGGPAKVGSYVATCTALVTNSGVFNVVDPDGVLVGTLGGVGTFTGGGITFAIADGATDWAVGDSVVFPVAEGSGQVKLLDKTAIDGSQVFDSIALEAVTTDGSTTQATPVAESGSFREESLTFAVGTDIDDVRAAMRDANCYVRSASEGVGY